MLELGLIREPFKGCWDHPTQNPEIYGFVIDLVGIDGRGLVIIPDKKKEDLILALTAIRDAQGSPASARFVARVAGKVISAAMAFSPARAWSAEFFWGIDARNREPWAWDKKDVWISQGMATDASFMINALDSHNGKLIWPGIAAVLLRWDAHPRGWGGALWTHPAQIEPVAQAGGQWKDPWLGRHINDLEPQALLNVMLSLEPFVSGRVVQPQGDSTTANASVSEFRGSIRSGVRNQVAKRLWVLAQRFSCTLLHVQYVNTRDNTWADERTQEIDTSDWELARPVWKMLDNLWGPHTWDRFASITNTKCESFTARWFQPGCHWPDALTQHWSNQNNFCCPPECIILAALNKVMESGTEATFVIPSYPARWTSLLSRMEVERCTLPPVRVSFIQGPSGYVEPWKSIGKNAQRTYVAVRVKWPRT
jgi:hypothetical protein